MKKVVILGVAGLVGLGWGATFDVRDYGAVGDGKTKNTAAVQKAIDACVEKGGGRVLVAGGTYMTAPVKLGTGVELHIAEGATLLGSPDLEDYPNRTDVKHVATEKLPRGRNVALIFAEKSRDVSITGKGTIDANGQSFVKPKEGDKWTGWHFERKVDLSKSMPRIVFMAGCTNVTVTGVKVVNGPAGWSYWIHDCDGVLFDGCEVKVDVRYPNNDGIHINSSRDVVIRNCDLETGDDSIVVRANNRSLRDNKTCERVVVSNCVLRSWSSGIRIGWSRDGIIRDCLFENIKMRDTTSGISVLLPGVPPWIRYDYGREATLVENLTFRNIEMDGIYGRPLHFVMAGGADSWVEAVRGLKFENVRSRGLEGPLFVGQERAPFEGFEFKGCEFKVVGDDELPGYRRHGAADWERRAGQKSVNYKGFKGWRE